MSSASRTLRRMNKTQVRQILADIRRVLSERWHTIGETDTDAQDIYLLLLQGATDAQIITHLRNIETEKMGLMPGSSQQHLASVVAALREIDLELP